jgi:hypothetical protein
LRRGADRQLNLALHIAAHAGPHARQRRYLPTTIEDPEGKTHHETRRCLKRRLADHVWCIMIANEP